MPSNAITRDMNIIETRASYAIPYNEFNNNESNYKFNL